MKITKETLSTGTKRKITQQAFKREMVKRWDGEHMAEALTEQIISGEPYQTEKYKYYAENQEE